MRRGSVRPTGLDIRVGWVWVGQAYSSWLPWKQVMGKQSTWNKPHHTTLALLHLLSSILWLNKNVLFHTRDIFTGSVWKTWCNAACLRLHLRVVLVNTVVVCCHLYLWSCTNERISTWHTHNRFGRPSQSNMQLWCGKMNKEENALHLFNTEHLMQPLGQTTFDKET